MVPTWKVIDNFIPLEDVVTIAQEVKGIQDWVVYHNNDENKRTSNNISNCGDRLHELVEFMQGKFVQEVENTLGIKPLMSDPLLHGGGIHASGNGGKLSVHLDYAKHPRLPLLERRANAILYLNPYWLPEWGGATLLTKPDGKTVIERCEPAPGRLLLFETSDLSYHGVEPVTCPDGVERLTLATYYLSHIRPGVTRERALFIPSR